MSSFSRFITFMVTVVIRYVYLIKVVLCYLSQMIGSICPLLADLKKLCSVISPGTIKAILGNFLKMEEGNGKPCPYFCPENYIQCP